MKKIFITREIIKSFYGYKKARFKKMMWVMSICLGFFGLSFYIYGKENSLVNFNKNANKNSVIKNEKSKSDMENNKIGENNLQLTKTNSQQGSFSKKEVKFNTNQWSVYKNSLYGFQLKYPNGWDKPISIKNSAQNKRNKWVQKIIFQKKQEISEQVENLKKGNTLSEKEGFEVVIYSRDSIQSLSETGELILKTKQSSIDKHNNFFKIFNPESKTARDTLVCSKNNSQNECKVNGLIDHFRDLSQFMADEINIPLNDECFESVLFFTITGEEYIYNIIPFLKKDGVGREADQQEKSAFQLTREYLPEFFAIAKEFELTEIAMPESIAKVPVNKAYNSEAAKKKAPMPVSYKRVGGKLVCAKKNDKPVKSKKNNKGKIHMDMECCLDPDEIPNPHCTYEAKKYQKYLQNPPKMKDKSKGKNKNDDDDDDD